MKKFSLWITLVLMVGLLAGCQAIQPSAPTPAAASAPAAEEAAPAPGGGRLVLATTTST